MTTILLNPSKETAIDRVAKRSPRVGVYTGTLSEVKGSILQHGNPDLSLYGLVIDTSLQNSVAVTQQIKEQIYT